MAADNCKDTSNIPTACERLMFWPLGFRRSGWLSTTLRSCWRHLVQFRYCASAR